jgi:gluconokinase
METRFIIIMGVTGSGKTTIGQALADILGWDFFDADDYHTCENIAKMANGIPLTDEDRLPWLATLEAKISNCLKDNHPGVLACSALKEAYRQILLSNHPEILIIYLRGGYELILSRLSTRTGHFMQSVMLQSQLDILEEPENALVVDINSPVDIIVEEISMHINKPI